MGVRAVIFDLGGVVFPSPFEAFDAYEHDRGLAEGSIRALIRISSETGAWAALERGELTMHEFHDALEAEARLSGFALEAEALMQRVAAGFGPRPAMVRAIERIRDAGFTTAALTNNWIA
ncbi:MAG: putative hydrolase of the superfamily, partial [Actinomycetota bacterium]|nr:putative hydrolase of the superfamily [Actinomycetota bacterium]